MKIHPRDVLYTSLGLLLTLAPAVAVLVLAAPPLQGRLPALYPVALLLAFFPVYGLLAAGYLRLLLRLRPLQPGTYDFDHPQVTLWKHTALMGDLARAALSFLDLSMSRVLYYRLLGVRVGRHVGIGRINLTDPTLTTLADLAIVGDGSTLAAHALTLDRLVLRPVTVGFGATVGMGAVLMPGVSLGENAVLAPLARLDIDTAVPPAELWDGIPARKVKSRRPSRFQSTL